MKPLIFCKVVIIAHSTPAQGDQTDQIHCVSDCKSRLYFCGHLVAHVLSDEVMTRLQQRYTCTPKEEDDEHSLLTLRSFVHCCCRIVCMLGMTLYTLSPNFKTVLQLIA